MPYSRYAIYYTCPEGPLADLAAAWLGWDIARGQPVAHPALPFDVEAATRVPRKYGFHGTLKPPFRLATGRTEDALRQSLAAFARATSPAELDGLRLSRLGRFLALVPAEDSPTLEQRAAACVTEFDAYRAPLSEAELARRRARPLSPAQEANLTRWGYPFVLGAFRFHMTLTGRLSDADCARLENVLSAYLGHALPAPFVLDAVSLCGERADGRFEVISRHALTG